MNFLNKKALVATILAFFAILSGGFGVANAGVPDGAIPGSDDIKSVSMNAFEGTTTQEKASNAAMGVLGTAKMIINGLAIIYIVYIGVMMVVAYGDDGQLSKQKRQLIYTLVAFLFVNVPGQIYNVFSTDKNGGDRLSKTPTAGEMAGTPSWGNIFISFGSWNDTIEGGVVTFIRVAVISLAVFYFTLAGIKIIVSWGNEETVKTAKRQAIYGFMSLIFLGIIQAWGAVVYSGDLHAGQSLFASLANLSLFFAGPVAIFFLIIGAWYYITSAGDDEKAKKGKTIVINTFIAVIILLASYTFLNDLAVFDIKNL